MRDEGRNTNGKRKGEVKSGDFRILLDINQSYSIYTLQVV